MRRLVLALLRLPGLRGLGAPLARPVEADPPGQPTALAAKETCAGCQAERQPGLLVSRPEERAAHPAAGHALVLGPMLYENHSNAERIFFDLSKFAHAITFKGAYHQSPDHAHWLGFARLMASLEELRAEERRLRKAE